MSKPEDPIRFNDEEFEFDKLPLVAQKDIIAIQNLDKSLDNMATQMDILQMARQGYLTRLNITIKEYKDAVQEQTEEGIQPKSAVS